MDFRINVAFQVSPLRLKYYRDNRISAVITPTINLAHVLS